MNQPASAKSGILMPELPEWCADCSDPLRSTLLETLGLIGAWLHPSALLDGKSSDEVLCVLLMEDGREFSDAIKGANTVLVLSGIAGDALELALETDVEITETLAEGYRLCGVDEEVNEMELLAKQIRG